MIISLIISLILIFGIPLLAVLFAAHSGMAICMLSFYIVNPVLSVWLGVFAGFNIKNRWYTCLFTGVIFIITVCLLLTASEPLFLYYSLVYTFFSTLSMIVTHLIVNRKK